MSQKQRRAARACPCREIKRGRDKVFFFYSVHLLPRTVPSLGQNTLSSIGMQVRRAAIAYVNIMIAHFETLTRSWVYPSRNLCR
jgi:hypothetical protein